MPACLIAAVPTVVIALVVECRAEGIVAVHIIHRAVDPLFRIFGKAAVQLRGNDSAYIAITSAIDNVFYGFTQRAIKAAH